VPDPHLPFLGVHFTRTIHGTLKAGPNAVLAFAKEGYRKTSFKLRDSLETCMYKGFFSFTMNNENSLTMNFLYVKLMFNDR